MERWTEVRTAFAVIAHGTISAAAEQLGVHRATVIRHIDALEDSLGVPLFQRHARGYTPTEAARDLERIARTIDEQLDGFAHRAREQHTRVSGDIVVTSVPLVVPVVTRALARFQAAHPDTRVRYVASNRILELEYGEAHVAVRGGPKPVHPDNIVRPLRPIRVSLYAHASYVDAHGLPESEDELKQHRFVGHEQPEGNRFFRWLVERISSDSIVLQSESIEVLLEAIRSGMGIGFMPDFLGCAPGMHEVPIEAATWSVPMWLVTHVDLHRTAKVQALSHYLVEEAPPVR